ncbi:MAG TPA: glycosyltransferase [Verrucomicrobiae bacterium]|nr:glycosyltransferase [Verrucomicrobiae bacterium]
MLPEAPTVSVVIASYRRRSHLLKVLDQLVPQVYQPHEVFVVDASPLVEQLTDSQVAGYPDWLYYLRYVGRGNASRQRNEALMRCSGDIVLFLDDDVEFGPSLLEKYVAAFRDSAADGVNGVVLIPGEKLSQAPKLLHPIPIQRPGGPNYQAYDGIIETHVICSANFAATRSALVDVGGFDEQLYGTRDDVDLALRMVRKGFRVVHHNGPQVLHLMVRGNGSRSPELGLAWSTTNLFYFQFTHRWLRYRRLLLWRTLWDYCRPSRHWLTPRLIGGRWLSVFRAYHEALSRVKDGPKFSWPPAGDREAARGGAEGLALVRPARTVSHG